MRRSAAAPRFCPGANYQRHFATREAESRSRAMRVPRKQRAGAARALRAPERLPFGVSSARERASADLVGTGKVQGRYREGTGKVQGRYRESGRVRTIGPWPAAAATPPARCWFQSASTCRVDSGE